MDPIRIIKYRKETDDYIIQDEYHHLLQLYNILSRNNLAPDTNFTTKTDSIIPGDPIYGYITISTMAIPFKDYIRKKPDRAYDIYQQTCKLLETVSSMKIQFYTLMYNNIYVEKDVVKIFPTKESSFEHAGKRHLARIWTLPPLQRSIYDMELYRPYTKNNDSIAFPSNYSYSAYQNLISSGRYIDWYLDYWWFIISILLDAELHRVYSDMLAMIPGDIRAKILYNRGSADLQRIYNIIRGSTLDRRLSERL